MEFINLTDDNIQNEHICCAIADKKHQAGVQAKKQWIQSQLNEGHVFRKLNAQGKVFIEYTPLEKAWVPISGDNYIYIYCLWVAGSFKGKGYANELITYAIEDAKKQAKSGLCTLVSKKKQSFLGEKKFFEHYGFKVVDSINDYLLMAFSFNDNIPSFNDSARKMEIEQKECTIYYSPQCPYTLDCITQIKEYCANAQIPIHFILIDTLEKAKNMPCVFNNWAVFLNGKLQTHILLNKNSFEKMLESAK